MPSPVPRAEVLTTNELDEVSANRPARLVDETDINRHLQWSKVSSGC